jgi:prepilin-type N-terminal cleavage/methylation domain-containing protein
MTPLAIQNRRRQQGFTLAELIVASTLMAVVMSAVYVSFHSAIRVWRSGDRSAEAYQDARIALSVMSRELHSLVAGTEHLVRGTNSSIEFYTVSPPMDPEQADSTRVLWVRYQMARTTGSRGRTLQRTEASVTGPLPFWEVGQPEPISSTVRLGRRRSFDLATGLRDLELGYLWVMPPTVEAPVFNREPLEVGENREGWGLPQGVRIRLTMMDEFSERGHTAFQTLVVFRGRTTELGEGLTGGPAGGYFQ